MIKKWFGDWKVNLRRGIFLLLGIGFAVFLYFFNQVELVPLQNQQGTSYEKAKVVRVLEDNLQEDGTRAGSQTVELMLLSGEYAGETVKATSLSGYLYGANCEPGMEVTAYVSESDGNLLVSVYNYYRAPVLYLLIGLFWQFCG